MKMISRCGVVLCLLFCWPCLGQTTSSRGDSIELQAVLFSDCISPQQKAEPQDLWPVRVIHANIERVGGTVSIQYREFDEACKRTFTRSGKWTPQQFEDAKTRLQQAGMRDGRTIALTESSGNNLPISFLKVQSPGLKADIYTMYLRFRWAGKMSTDDPTASKVLDEWRSLLREATPEAAKGAAEGEGIAELARNCAQGWPQSLQHWLLNEARKLAKPNPDCLSQQGDNPK